MPPAEAAASQTALASASAPLPPSAQFVDTTASRAPAARATSRTTAYSADVSVGKALIATTTGTP